MRLVYQDEREPGALWVCGPSAGPRTPRARPPAPPPRPLLPSSSQQVPFHPCFADKASATLSPAAGVKDAAAAAAASAIIITIRNASNSSCCQQLQCSCCRIRSQHCHHQQFRAAAPGHVINHLQQKQHFPCHLRHGVLHAPPPAATAVEYPWLPSPLIAAANIIPALGITGPRHHQVARPPWPPPVILPAVMISSNNLRLFTRITYFKFYSRKC